MKLQFYNSSSANNVINKKLTLVGETNIHLKATTDLDNPQLIFLNDGKIDFTRVNYVKMLNRCYFVSYETMKNTRLINLIMKLDVLETYKDNILNSEADIIKKSTPSNINQTDVEAETENKTYKSDVTLKDGKTIIAVTDGSNFYNSQKEDANK